VETIAAGWNRLWKEPDYAPRRDIAAFGDGHAAHKAVEIIVNFLKCREKAASKPSS
jgi:UDP-GlcNAc3NAcA epimerase